MTSRQHRSNWFRVAMAVGVLMLFTNPGCAEAPVDSKEVPAPTAKREGKPTKETLVNFEKAEVDKIPPGFTSALTGSGPAPMWVVKQDGSSAAGGKVLAQTSADDTGRRYPVCVYDDITAKDVTVTIRFRPVSGKVDQAAGIVWRYQDKDNYYVVRANALENNVVLYKTEGGTRTDLKIKGKTTGYGIKADVPKDRWSTLSVMVAGDSFIVSLNDKPLFEVVDQTFQKPGKVGVWTKADSVTHFDDFKVEVFDQ
jgi:hypothetical protein